jgi:hypothetical protein
MHADVRNALELGLCGVAKPTGSAPSVEDSSPGWAGRRSSLQLHHQEMVVHCCSHEARLPSSTRCLPDQDTAPLEALRWETARVAEAQFL